LNELQHFHRFNTSRNIFGSPSYNNNKMKLSFIFALDFLLILSSGGTSTRGGCLCQIGNQLHSGIKTADNM
jgi:hypothetical protein